MARAASRSASSRPSSGSWREPSNSARISSSTVAHVRQQLAEQYRRVAQVGALVQRVAHQRCAPLDQLHHVGKRLVGRGEAQGPVGRGGEDAEQVVLGGHAAFERLLHGRAVQPRPDRVGDRVDAAPERRAERVRAGPRRDRDRRGGAHHGGEPPARQPVGDHRGGARRGHRQHVGEHRRDPPGGGVRAEHARVEHDERDGQRHERGEQHRAAHERADRQQRAAGQRQPEVCPEPVAHGPAEGAEQQRREAAEGGERRHLRVAEHFVGQREQTGGDDRRSHRAQRCRGRPDRDELPQRACGARLRRSSGGVRGRAQQRPSLHPCLRRGTARVQTSPEASSRGASRRSSDPGSTRRRRGTLAMVLATRIDPLLVRVADACPREGVHSPA